MDNVTCHADHQERASRNHLQVRQRTILCTPSLRICLYPLVTPVPREVILATVSGLNHACLIAIAPIHGFTANAVLNVLMHCSSYCLRCIVQQQHGTTVQSVVETTDSRGHLLIGSFWDGSGHRRKVTVRKGDSIEKFLRAVREQVRSTKHGL